MAARRMDLHIVSNRSHRKGIGEVLPCHLLNPAGADRGLRFRNPALFRFQREVIGKDHELRFIADEMRLVRRDPLAAEISAQRAAEIFQKALAAIYEYTRMLFSCHL